MARIWMTGGGGGGADLDVITAGAGDVLDGKVIVDKEGNPLTGAIPIRGAVSQELAAGGSYTVPAGYHNGAGVITAKNLASQTGANALAADIRRNKTAWVNGVRLTGSMTEKGAATYTPRTSNQTIAAGQYLTGTQTIKGDANLVASKIKKGVTIFGVTGTFEGYVAAATDLYNRGVRQYGLTSTNSHCFFETSQIRISNVNQVSASASLMYTDQSINLSGYSGVRLCVAPLPGAGVEGTFYLDRGKDGDTLGKTARINIKSEITIDIPFTVSTGFTSSIGVSYSPYQGTHTMYIYQITLY